MKFWSEEEENFVVNNYIGMDVDDMSAVLGRTIISIRSKANRLGLFKESRFLSVNENFFLKWSHEMASIFGFIIADGHVSSDLNSGNSNVFTVGQSKKSMDLLEKINFSIQSNYSIYKRKDDFYFISINNTKLVGDLVSLGVCDKNKSYNQTWPYVPDEFVNSFILGIFNGDGCITYRRYKNKVSVTLSICGNINVVTGIRDTIERITGIEGGIYRVSSIWDIKFQSKKAKKVLDWMYKDVNSGALVLDRKYNRYKLLDEDGYYPSMDELKKIDY